MRWCRPILRYNMAYKLRTPIDLDLLKTEEGRGQLRRSVKARFKPQKIVDELIGHQQAYRKALFEIEGINRQANSVKEQIKIKVKAKESKQTLVEELNQIKQQQASAEAILAQKIKDLQVIAASVGNIVDPQILVSKDEANNRVIKQCHTKTIKIEGGKDRIGSYEWLTQQFGVAEMARGQKVAGHRGYFLGSNGLKLALGLAQYGLEHLEKNGYSTYQTPALMLEEVMKESCQLSDIGSEVYQIEGEPLCLIATSEQTLAGFHRNQTIEKSKIPIRMGGYSTCFRKQAGAHGKDIHGLFRVHQFQKVEQFVLTTPQNSAEQMKRMVEVSSSFYEPLGIPFRLVEIVSGALNDAASKKVDLEGWYPSQGRFRELVSVSNCMDYQARLLNTRYRQGKTTFPVHMLNGTLVAIQRTITCLLQHCYDQTSHSLRIPQALQPYLRTDRLHPINKQ